MNWLRYSGIWITLVGNPYHWRISFSGQTDLVWAGPDTKEYAIQLVCVSVRVVIDNGQY
jgi:hypothetical protein